jgi:hypothetical protein
VLRHADGNPGLPKLLGISETALITPEVQLVNQAGIARLFALQRYF